MESTLLTINEVMEKLKISRKTLHTLTKGGKIKSVKIGGSVRYQDSELDRFIAESTVVSEPQS